MLYYSKNVVMVTYQAHALEIQARILIFARQNMKNIMETTFKNGKFRNNLLWTFVGFVSSGFVGYLLFKTITLAGVINLLQMKNNDLIYQLKLVSDQVEELKDIISFLNSQMELLDKRLVQENNALEHVTKELVLKQYVFYLL